MIAIDGHPDWDGAEGKDREVEEEDGKEDTEQEEKESIDENGKINSKI